MSKKYVDTNGKKNTERAAAYAAVSALLSLIGIGGLFLGYLYRGAPVGYAIAGGEPIMKGTLLGVALEVLQGSISMPKISSVFLAGYLSRFLYLTVFLLIGALILSLALTITAMVKRTSAKKLCLFNGRILLAPYLLLFFGNMLLSALTQGAISFRSFDVPTAMISIAILLVLFFTSLPAGKSKSAFGFLLTVLSLMTVFAFAFPNTALLHDLNDVTLLRTDVTESTRIVLLVLCGVSFMNIILSVVRINAKGAFLFDVFRFGTQFLVTLALIATYYITQGGMFVFFTIQPYTAALLIVPPLAAFMLSAFATALYAGVKLPKREHSTLTQPDTDEQVEAIS